MYIYHFELVLQSEIVLYREFFICITDFRLTDFSTVVDASNPGCDDLYRLHRKGQVWGGDEEKLEACWG